MLDSLTVNNFRDFSQRYQNTYGWYVDNQTNRKTFVHVVRVEPEAVHFQTDDKQTWIAYADRGVLFEFVPVKRGVYLTLDDAFYLERRPARQWNRGISPNNTNIYKYFTGEWRAAPGLFTTYATIFNKQITPEASLHAHFTHGISRFLLNQHFICLDGILWFNMQKVGEYKEGVIRVTQDLVKQEIQDAVKRIKSPNKLEVV